VEFPVWFPATEDKAVAMCQNIMGVPPDYVRSVSRNAAGRYIFLASRRPGASEEEAACHAQKRLLLRLPLSANVHDSPGISTLHSCGVVDTSRYSI
jgi:hypothetical protein